MPETADTVDKETTFTNYKSVLSKQFAVSLVVECVGVMFFQILGATATKEMGPFVNGFALAVWIYTAANISGGHLNPAVTFSVFICGFFPLIHSLFYVALQVVGAIIGSWVTSALVPGAHVNMGDGGPGCFDRGVVNQINDGQLFGWELVMTFTLISCVYACGIAKPGHGSHTPLVVGLALLCCAGSGGQYTGAALNPARVLGPLAIFSCGKDVWWIYIVAQLAAALLACSLFAFVSGAGPLNPFTSTRTLRLRWHEAIWLMISGLPPKRLRVNDKDNITDLITREASFHASPASNMPPGPPTSTQVAASASPRRRRPDPMASVLPTSRSP
ncbi:unnamed protein product [Polarella glacialis]|uniref:Aquaporin n=1 Tax=Polarella glacialis TaxID=89957 RepID=A0A813E932_POLGL|nr:unnamed protein product [Polarella glacialis]CAE8647856.1 unnamed protein product [Polarella glacialis]